MHYLILTMCGTLFKVGGAQRWEVGQTYSESISYQDGATRYVRWMIASCEHWESKNMGLSLGKPVYVETCE